MRGVTFLEAFNAKQMETSEVVDSFVPSQKFYELAGPWHALLIGPRGSGKTTLLKMLALKALRRWSHPEAENVRKAINYTGIFVPADITWGAMVGALGGGQLKADCFNAFATAAFCTNVLQAAVDAMEDRIKPTEGSTNPNYRVANVSASNLEYAVREIAAAWKLRPRALSINALRSSLGHRLLELKAKASEIPFRAEQSLESVYKEIDYLALDFNEALIFALAEFDRAIEHQEGKWALLLDEFEIAPEHIQKLVLANLRSANTKLIYKVGLAPCGPHTQASLATLSPPNKGNDFRQIELWYSEKRAANAFCEELFRARMAKYPLLASRSPEEILGQSSFAAEPALENEETSYGRGDLWKDIFISLSEKDQSFHFFLDQRGIDPNKLDPSPLAPNGNTIRKIAPLVAFRNAYLRNKGVHALKGRKKLLFAYSGWEAIVALSEGNPRWLITILNMIASRVADDSKLPVPKNVQHDQILDATHAFSSMLQTVATEQSIGIHTTKPIYDVLSTIGAYFHNRLTTGPFIEEPPLSFEIDENVDTDTENALRIAFNHGAIVCLSELEEIGGFKTLKGKRFRLAYLLAPQFKLPLRATKVVALSTILATYKEANAVVQRDLFS